MEGLQRDKRKDAFLRNSRGKTRKQERKTFFIVCDNCQKAQATLRCTECDGEP